MFPLVCLPRWLSVRLADKLHCSTCLPALHEGSSFFKSLPCLDVLFKKKKKERETFSATSPLQAWNSLCRADWAQSPGDPPASALWMLGLKRAAVLNPDVYCDHGSVYGMEFKFLLCFHTGLHLPVKLGMTLDIWHSPASTSEHLDYQHVYRHAWAVPCWGSNPGFHKCKANCRLSYILNLGLWF